MEKPDPKTRRPKLETLNPGPSRLGGVRDPQLQPFFTEFLQLLKRVGRRTANRNGISHELFRPISRDSLPQHLEELVACLAPACGVVAVACADAQVQFRDKAFPFRKDLSAHQ